MMYEHNGCEGCLHRTTEETSLPCVICKGTVNPYTEWYGIAADCWEPDHADNPYWDNVSEIAERQRNKGFEKYGQGIEANKSVISTRLEYLEEELVDALFYLEWIKDYMKGGTDNGNVTERKDP